MAVLTMAQSNKKNNNNINIAEDVKPSVFHDFLGRECASESLPVAAKAGAGEARPLPEAAPSASASVGASSSGGRGPISTTSDLGSERRAGNHFEGVPFYGLRSDFSGPEIACRFTGHKRGNSDSAFMGSSRNGLPQVRPYSLESSHLVKMLRSAGGERPRRPQDEEAFFGMHPMRPTSASLVLQTATSGRADANTSKWERAIPISVGHILQNPPWVSQVVPFGYHASSNRFKDANAGPSIISQAADEGSRTGIKGSGILSSINASVGIADKNMPSDVKQKSGTHISELEPSTSQSRQGVTSASRLMTIFYGGQAHVFDEVHPNKADVIVALAGSNGGSWSTNYTPKSAVRPPPSENDLPSGDNDTCKVTNPAFQREFCGRLYLTGNSSLGFGSADQISMPPGFHQGSIVVKEARGPNQVAELNTEKKPQV